MVVDRQRSVNQSRSSSQPDNIISRLHFTHTEDHLLLKHTLRTICYWKPKQGRNDLREKVRYGHARNLILTVDICHKRHGDGVPRFCYLKGWGVTDKKVRKWQMVGWTKKWRVHVIKILYIILIIYTYILKLTMLITSDEYLQFSFLIFVVISMIFLCFIIKGAKYSSS